MRKAVLEGNILPKAKQRFLVDGYTGADIIYLTRDVIEMAVGVIELADQTRVPGGRIRSGDFTVTLQFARDKDRETYLDWFENCVDVPGDGSVGGGHGINPTYKRNATIIYYRLFTGSTQGYPSGSDSPPVVARLYGCWRRPSKSRIMTSIRMMVKQTPVWKLPSTLTMLRSMVITLAVVVVGTSVDGVLNSVVLEAKAFLSKNKPSE